MKPLSPEKKYGCMVFYIFQLLLCVTKSASPEYKRGCMALNFPTAIYVLAVPYFLTAVHRSWVELSIPLKINPMIHFVQPCCLSSYSYPPPLPPLLLLVIVPPPALSAHHGIAVTLLEQFFSLHYLQTPTKFLRERSKHRLFKTRHRAEHRRGGGWGGGAVHCIKHMPYHGTDTRTK